VALNVKLKIYLSSPHMGSDERRLVEEAFDTNWIAPLGPHVDAFEREFVTSVGTRFAAALSSGTAAIHLALRLVGTKPGDEVFVSSLTFSASVNPIAYESARPVFIDSDRASWNMDPTRLEEALADRAKKGWLPKAVILVHLYGQSADIDPIAALCTKYNVPLIEDAAEALGALYYTSSRGGGSIAESIQPGLTSNEKRITDNAPSGTRSVSPGTVGQMGIYSFNGNKIITTSGGGMLVSDDEALIKKARFLATQARDPAPHYQHSEIGYNYRMSNVLAAIGRGQLRVLNDRVEARRQNCEFYQKAFADLPGIEFMPEAPWGRCTRWLTCILLDPKQFGADSEAIRLALEAENIEARPVWKPMHLQPVFAGCDRFGGEVAEDLFNRGLCLPSGSNLTESDLQRVVEAIRKVHRR
jgi:dTDP-4-amino-4,6-dideoxygalactose transaminase